MFKKLVSFSLLLALGSTTVSAQGAAPAGGASGLWYEWSLGQPGDHEQAYLEAENQAVESAESSMEADEADQYEYRDWSFSCSPTDPKCAALISAYKNDQDTGAILDSDGNWCDPAYDTCA
eukprot:TRINITY_DN3820_c0_g1_i1.p2 TRINITY_DN3820_c0_g1~~TRINITY_DN3820_c0_g1_i1.p2  ORF type:complete len:121 (-),score=26.14 TRINITY_DN3820_c0_g1_i1:75-437(-)